MDLRCLEDFDFLVTVTVRGRCGKRNGGGYTSGESEIWMGRGVAVGVVSGAAGIGNRGGLWTDIVEVIELSE